MNNGDVVFQSWSGGELPTTFRPWPSHGFLAHSEANPPGTCELHWYETRDEAVRSLGLYPEDAAILSQGERYVDTTPEGSSGSKGDGVYPVDELPEWVENLPKDLGWDGSSTARGARLMLALQADPEWAAHLSAERMEDTPAANARRGEAARLYQVSRLDVSDVVREYDLWLEGLA
jgi:hypothetical protein